MMNVFSRLKKAKETFKAKRLEYIRGSAERLKEKVKYAKALAQENKSIAQSKAELAEARRVNNPLLYKIGENIKTNARKSYNQNQKRIGGGVMRKETNNIFTQSTGNPYFLNGTSSQPYWLKKKR